MTKNTDTDWGEFHFYHIYWFYADASEREWLLGTEPVCQRLAILYHVLAHNSCRSKFSRSALHEIEHMTDTGTFDYDPDDLL